jgi:flavodoxin
MNEAEKSKNILKEGIIMSGIKTKKSLIAYFTFSGITKKAATFIKEHTGGSLFHIDTVNAYPNDHKATVDVAEKEFNENARPTLTAKVENIDSYDVVFIAFPNWWGTMPMALFTFLEQYDLTGKIIIPLCTHEGSGMGRSEDDIKRLCPNAVMGKGLAVRGKQVAEAEDKIVDWLKQL